MARVPTVAPASSGLPRGAAAARTSAGRFRLVPRPRLEATLDGVLGCRLGLVVADVGFGKSTLVTAWATAVNAVVLDVTPADRDPGRFARRVVEALRSRVPELSTDLLTVPSGQLGDPSGDDRAQLDAMAEAISSELGRHLLRDLPLVLDDGHLLGEGPASGFLDALVRHAPPLLHLVLASRAMPALRIDRLRRRGDVVELHGADLAFTEDEVALLVDSMLGGGISDLAAMLHEATAGWPAALRLLLEPLRAVDGQGRAAYARELLRRRGGVAALTDVIVEQEPVATRRLLATVALFGEVTTDLLAHLGVDDGGTLDDLRRRGLFVERGPSGPGWYRLHAMTAEAVARHHELTSEEAAQLCRSGASWLVEHELTRAAIRVLVAARQPDGVRSLLRTSGRDLLRGGFADEVLEGIASLPPGGRDAWEERLAGEALQLRGDWEEALAHYARSAPSVGALEPGLAWRMGLIHYLRGEPQAALAVYGRGDVGEEPSRDAALLLAWTAAAHWGRGEAERCGRLAVQALGMATAVDDPQALAAVHTVLAMLAALEGDRHANDAHYRKALQCASQAGDVLQLVRIRTNRGSYHLEEGAYALALEELDEAIRTADLAGFAAFGALALSNRGEALLGLGRLEEAQAELESAVVAFRAAGSGMAAYALNGLGRVAALRRDVAAAREAFTEALGLAEAAGDVQGEVPALCGLARLLAEEDADRAAELADRALATGTGLAAVAARLAAGWVALRRDDRSAACRYARQAGREGERRRDRAGLADALVLEAAATLDAARAAVLAERAGRLSAELGDPVGAARADLVRARHLGHESRPLLISVRDRMRAIGCRSLELEAVRELERSAVPSEQRVRIETFGGLRVLHDGQQVPSATWKSRQAREVVKLLVSRRGRAVPRDFLVEQLWPGRSPDEIGNRLNVLLSTIRSVLDPQRRRGDDGALCGDGEAVWLDLDRIEVDVESFLSEAATGLQLLREQREAEAVGHLLRAEAAYTGEYLDDTPYEDWAAGVREEARAAYRQVAVALVRHAVGSGDTDAAVRYLLRILERDPYDESAHLDLVGTLAAAGRHTDARRRYRAYAARMEELGVDAVPFPAR